MHLLVVIVDADVVKLVRKLKLASGNVLDTNLADETMFYFIKQFIDSSLLKCPWSAYHLYYR